MPQIMNLVFDGNTSIFGVSELNSSFARASLRVMYLGDNRNGSHFSKEDVIRAIPSIKNVPIVCNYDFEDGTIGAHDIELARDKNGKPFFRNLTEPCGVVPEHATHEFVVEKDDEGNEHEYLVLHDVLLWKRQDVYKHIVEDLGGKVNHSMEISVSSGEKNSSGYYVVHDFEFTALCLLETAEPCFQGSQLELYSASHFKKKMNEMMAELRSTFSAVNLPSGSDDRNDSITTEGGEKILDSTNETIIETQDVSTEALKEEAEPEINKGDFAPTDEAESYSLVGTIVNEITRVLDAETVECAWGELCRYIYVDCDIDAGEVYCYDVNDWLLYGFNFTLNGDTVTIDYDSRKRKKFIIADFEGDDQNSPLHQVFSQIEEKITELKAISQQFAEVSNQIEQANAEIEILRAFKEETEMAALNTARSEILDKFSGLIGIEAFDALCEDCQELAPSELEEKCFAILGRCNANSKYALNTTKPVKLAVPQPETNEAEDPYGGLVEKYTKENN